jgi:SAM-dependent methyltransferase
MRRRVLKRTDLLLVRSPEAEQVARASGFDGPAMQIGYGVDRTGFAPRDRANARLEFGLSGFTIGYVGRIVEAKGLDDAIEALARTKQPATLAIMGEGPHLAQIKAKAGALGVADRVVYFGWTNPEAVARFMSAVDALVLLTRTTNAVREQFGRVIIEAQSCGTPVIGSECGAIPSVVGDGGWIIPERSPDALATLLDSLVVDPDMIRRAGAIGMAQVRSRFTYESVAATLVEAWRQSRTGERSTRRPVVAASCPICKSSDARLARRLSSKEVAQHYVRAEIDPDRHAKLLAHVETLWGSTGCEWLDCGQCGFGYATPFVAGDAVFYELASGNTPYPKWKWEFQRTFDRLRDTRIAQARTGRLLELGAGDGHLLQALGEAGWPKSAMLGLEYSSSGLAAMARRDIPSRAVDVRDPTVEGPFDVICLFQVLEHLDELDALFERLGALAAPGADLFIGVPNGDWQRANEALGTCDDFPPNHLSRWSPANFEMMAGRFGWRVEAIELEPIRRSQAARYAFAESFLRASETPGGMANFCMRVASHVPGKLPARALKAFGAGLEPACWAAALDRFAFASPSPNIWAHLSRAV